MEAGTTVGPFRVERLLATGSFGAVYEATQPSLGRTVALRLIDSSDFASPEELSAFDARQSRLAALHHPNIVSLYETGEWDGGRFIATRFIRGMTLAELQEDGLTLPAGALESVDDALRAAHAAGLVHGRISADNVLIESNGTAYLADLGLHQGGSPEDDREALTAVVSEFEARAAARDSLKPKRRLGVALALAIVITGAALLLALGDGEPESGPLVDAPDSPPRTTSVGSQLTPAATTPLGCIEDPSSNTPGCSFAQIVLGEDPIAVPRDGVIRGWAVRGAAGALSLQVIREREGRSFLVGFSQPEQVSDAGPQSFPADISVAAGDRIGVGLGPGATIGTVGAPGAEVARWDGRMTADPRPESATEHDVELMIRADIEFRAESGGPRQLTGNEAALAPRGIPLTQLAIELPVRGGVKVAVVRLPGMIAIDVSAGTRLARLEVPDADPDGELRHLSANCGPVVLGGFCLGWQNPGVDQALQHQYVVRQNGTIRVIG